MFYLHKIFTFLSDIKYSGNLFIQDWNDSLDDALSRLHVPCVCVCILSPIRYRPGEQRKNNNLSTGLKRHGEQSKLGVPVVPWRSDDEMLTRLDIEVVITDVAGNISVRTYWNPAEPEMLIVVNFGLMMVFYRCMTVAQFSYAYIYQVLISFNSFVAKYWLCRLGLDVISTYSARVACNRLSNPWNNNSYCMWLRLCPQKFLYPKYIFIGSLRLRTRTKFFLVQH